ncbi:MAG: hypothetical protein MUF49_24740 [Oculatellaceae cyanobacterium Prado106]|jgi:nitrogenase-associated protein|nr:hypothetical protein [Oculatellaceae cyanobacterium Prado106]
MPSITFYEKPGCINNTKQKALLQAAGYELEVRNLLTEEWSVKQLRPYFGDAAVVDWFNRTAPMVKSGEVMPEGMDEATALALMVEYPILIRRPLMRVGDRYQFGWNAEAIEAWLGLTPVESAGDQGGRSLREQDLENCPRQASASSSASQCH